MDTPGQISSHASSSMPSQSDQELEDEVCENEIHDDVILVYPERLDALIFFDSTYWS